jgi:GNAT superfamily N-acetyltransferase
MAKKPEGQDVCVRLLTPKDDRTQFDSGDIDLDRFFKRFAGQNQFRHHIGSTYVAELPLPDGPGQIIGFVTVSPGELTAEVISQATKRKLPCYPIPILRIARLAVDASFAGQGVGKLLLKAMFELALELKDSVGCAGVVVDAKPDAVRFYERYGFIPLEVVGGALGDRPRPLPVFLSVKLIELNERG